jgi:cardiolipin synthase
LEWLKAQGVQVCITDLTKLRDNNLLYSPLWRLLLQWFGTGGRGANTLPSPVRKGNRTSIRALLMALNAKGNHRKVIVTDEGDGYLSLLTSSNFEDSSTYFLNTALQIRDANVARHFLEAEKALARVSGCEIDVEIEPTEARGDVWVTPLMGEQIKAQVIADLEAAQPGDEVTIIMLFLSERDVIEALVRASRRGVKITVMLDQNKVSFGEEKRGYPNQFVVPELARRTDIELRWGNTDNEEFHTKFMLIRAGERCIVHTGSANFTRRSLSGTNPEANVRVEAPLTATVSQELLRYARWMAQEPRTIPAYGDRSRVKYWFYRLQEAVGIATF